MRKIIQIAQLLTLNESEIIIPVLPDDIVYRFIIINIHANNVNKFPNVSNRIPSN
jgi:hypothetical protein